MAKENDCTEKFQLCPKFEKTFSMLGKRWNGLIIDVLLEEGPQRYNELATKIPVVSDRVLVERLKELELFGVVHRTVDPNNSKKVEYGLTEQGQDLKAVMASIQDWAVKWV